MGPRREIYTRIRGELVKERTEEQNTTRNAKPGIQTDPAQILSHSRLQATLAWKLGNNIDARK